MTYLSPEERVRQFNARYPHRPPLVCHNGRIYGVWMVGSQYRKRENYYGVFPATIMERILALFPDCKCILWLFSGPLRGPPDRANITYDINPRVRPTICDDVRNLLRYDFPDVDLVVADPPYDKEDFARYGVEPFSKDQVIRELWCVTRSPCYVAWLDTRVPIANSRCWKFLGLIGVYVGFKMRMRALALFERLEPETLPEPYRRALRLRDAIPRRRSVRPRALPATLLSYLRRGTES